MGKFALENRLAIYAECKMYNIKIPPQVSPPSREGSGVGL